MSHEETLQAVSERVRDNLTQMTEVEPGKFGAIDFTKILGYLGTIDEVVAKLYPVVSALFPGNVAAVATVIAQIIHALAQIKTS